MLQTGRRLGDFEIIRPLGKGGMGEVYEAQQGHPPRRVAVKVLAPWLAQDEAALKRFWREAAAPAQLDHPNIVRIFHTGTTDEGLAYYAMQLVRGLSLAELMRRAAAAVDAPTVTDVTRPDTEGRAQAAPNGTTPSGPISDPELPLVRLYQRDRFAAVVRIGVQAARALAAAHAQGVLHRDLKPSNLMVDRHDQLYVVDFGLMKALEPDGDESTPGMVRGTPWYMSPEQAAGKPLDARSDLYSLGVTLFELASGGLGPFAVERGDRAAVLHEVRRGGGLPLAAVVPVAPPGLAAVIERAMQPDRAQRYQTADELAVDLEALSKGPAAPPPPRRRPSRRLPRWALYAAGGGLLALALAAAALVRPPASPAPEPPGVGGKPEPDPNPLPPPLRERVFNHRIDLLKEGNQPLWSARLWGKGGPDPMPFQLALTSLPPNSAPTLLALDDDPARHWFEFAVQLQQPGRSTPGTNELGLFFGWRRDAGDPVKRSRFFVVQLDEQATDDFPNGRAMIGSAHLEGPDAHGRDHAQWSVPTARPKWVLKLPPPRKDHWRKVVIKAVDHEVTVEVDGVQKLLDRGDYRDLHQTLGGGPLDPRGALGVWARMGHGLFKGASVVALPSVVDP
jgi:serine/threonine protein kinase